MKTKFTLSLFALSVLLIFTQTISESNTALSFTSGPGAGNAGDPAGGNMTCRRCHGGDAPLTLPNIIQSNIPEQGYTPGITYTISATVGREGRVKFGFQITPQNEQGMFLGTLINTNTDTQLNSANQGYVNHTSSGTSGITGTKTWTFNWTAPVAGSGPVTFYGAFNITNNNNANTGDDIFLSRLTVKEAIATSVFSRNANTNANEISLFPNPSTEVINLEYLVQKENAVDITIVSMNGIVTPIFNSKNHRIGKYTLPINIENFNPGIYFIKITIGNATSTERFVIQ